MKMKIITITDNWKENSMQIMVPEGIWFNTSYELRKKLYEANTMTISQFLTTSNESIFQTVNNMHPKQIDLFYQFIDRNCDSKRADAALYIITRFF